MSARPGIWWKSFRPFSLVSSALPALFATALAAWRGAAINVKVCTAAVTIAVLIHLVTNLTNSLYDWLSGRDEPGSPQAVPILEHSPSGIASVRRCLVVLTCLTAAAAVWFGLLTTAAMVFWPIIGYLGGVYYTKPPVAYKHRGLGAAAVFTLLGLGAPTAAFQAQTGYADGKALLAFIPLAFLVTAIMLANEIRDYHRDRLSGSVTLVGLVGPPAGGMLYSTCLILPFGTVCLGVMHSILPPTCLAVFVCLPLAGSLWASIRQGNTHRLDLATARLYGIFSLCYTVALLWANYHQIISPV